MCLFIIIIIIIATPTPHTFDEFVLADGNGREDEMKGKRKEKFHYKQGKHFFGCLLLIVFVSFEGEQKEGKRKKAACVRNEMSMKSCALCE